MKTIFLTLTFTFDDGVDRYDYHLLVPKNMSADEVKEEIERINDELVNEWMNREGPYYEYGLHDDSLMNKVFEIHPDWNCASYEEIIINAI